MFLLVSLILFAQDRISLPRTASLELAHAALSQKGNLFILVPDQVKIYRYDIRGHLVAEITNRENQLKYLDKPVAINLYEDRLHITDHGRHTINIYDLSGNHLDSIDFDHRNIHPVRVKNGWLYFHDPEDENTVSGLYLTDSRGRSPRALTTYSNKSNGLHAMRGHDGSLKIRYNPAEDRALLAVTSDGSTAWFYTPGQRMLNVVDIESAEITQRIAIPRKPIKFDRGWGEEQVRLLGQGVSVASGLGAPKIDPVFPKWFPMISDLVMDHENKLWVIGYPDHKSSTDPVILNPDGSRTHSEYTRESIQRLIGVYHQKAFVLAFDPDESDAFVVICHLDQMNAITRLFPGKKPGDKTLLRLSP